jgi:NAD(P)-dependent dehydrogenase (short-subunit alcohol dehydrogenase family)
MSNPVFKDNVVVITGASRGIGEELALQLAEQGARLALAARDEEALSAVGAACRQRGAAVALVPTDVGDSEQCRTLIDRAVKEFGRIDTLVNNAGIGMWARFEEVKDPAIFERIMRINYLGAVYCTYHALVFLKQTRGRIVVNSSLAGKTGAPARSGYAASKHALVGLFDSMRPELAPSGVSVTIAYPDFVSSGSRFRNLGPDGKQVQGVPPYGADAMSSATCARLILLGAARRQREVVMTPRGRFGPWAKLIAPGLVDRIALRAGEKGT